MVPEQDKMVCRAARWSFFLILVLLTALLLSNAASAAETIKVSTNRYVILGDNVKTGAIAAPGFYLPRWGDTVGKDAYRPWTGEAVTIRAYALYLDGNGIPVQGKNITFRFFNPGGGVFETKYGITNSSGMASASSIVGNAKYYGNWQVTGSNAFLSSSSRFIYNWWGCNYGDNNGNDCNKNHDKLENSDRVTTALNSPYLEGYEREVGVEHDSGSREVSTNTCLICHRSYDGSPGSSNTSVDRTSPSRILNGPHQGILCANSSCHGNFLTDHTASSPTMTIGSCYGETGCHSFRDDVSGKTTLAGTSRYSSPPAKSNYSKEPLLSYHTPSSTVPCIICHGPMHNITKPDESLRSESNDVTEDSHCTTCHMDTKHSQGNPVYCTACHSQDVHAIKILGTDGTYKNLGTPGAITSSTADCTDCHHSGAANAFFGSLTSDDPLAYSTNFYPFNLYNARHPGASCASSCHDTSNFHSIGEGGGGPACLSCHDISASGATHKVDGAAMDNGVHANLNSGASASGVAEENKKCWGCHQSDGTQPSNDMGDIYLNPYRCYDCHGPTKPDHSSGALTVSEHFKNGMDIKAATSSIDNSASCIKCHNESEMKVTYTDNEYTEFSLASHYAKSRSDLRTSGSTDCRYCHQNASTAFSGAMVDPAWNASIQNHTSRTTSPDCTDSNCHNTGRIHESSLTKPVSNDDFCKACHGPTGGASTNNKVEHKTLYCTECHADSPTGSLAGRDVHGIKYLTMSNTFTTSSANAVDCVTCHQTSIVDSSLGTFSPFKIKTPLHHSDNLSNGSVWGTYWTSPQQACIFCHSDTKHNATPLGRILEFDPGYVMYEAIDTGTACSSCHYRGDSNYDQMTGTFTSLGIPPEITNVTNWNGRNGNYYNHSLTTYRDQDCRSCHGSLLSSGANMSEFLHNVARGAAGGPNCIDCHNLGGSVSPDNQVDFAAMNNGIHRNLNSVTPTNPNSKCWACHTDAPEGTQPSGHWTNKFTCEYCHVDNRFSAPVIPNHKPPKEAMSPARAGTGVTTGAYCSVCHNNSKIKFEDSANASVSHYGTNTSLLRPTANQTPLPQLGAMTGAEASSFNTECKNCHNPSNPDYGSGTLITNAHTSTGTCVQCHVNGNADNLHNGSLSMPATFGCMICHTTYADQYKAPNLTGTGHSSSMTTCSACGHTTEPTTPLQFDTLQDHNRDWTRTEYPPVTSTVYLNGSASLTVAPGTIVTIRSNISDPSGAYARKVRAAEYFTGSNPGVGKGTPMTAVDGKFDALNGALEAITADLDTSGMAIGTYTVSVRGMDIGKQWSSIQTATLTITEPTGYVNGTVTNSTGAAIPGVTVTAGTVSAVTNIAGFYSLSLPTGSHTLIATKDPEYYPVTIPSVTVPVDYTPVTQNIVMTKKPTGTISGFVGS